jgi:tRNA dimethylallyltransferase
MQVYRELRVLSARPDAADEAAAPHRLYGVLPASRRGSVGWWREAALAEIAAARAAGRVPIVVGGSGLYLKLLQEGIAPVPPVPEALRGDLRAFRQAEGDAALHARLAALDPEGAARLPAADWRRVLRALEVVLATGRSLASFRAEAPSPPVACRLVLLLPPRAPLVEAIDRRCAAMLEAGAIEEARAVIAAAPDPDLPARRAVGVGEIGRHLAGEIGLDEALELFRRATRQYAKRQVTWFRHQARGDLVLGEQFSESLMPSVFRFIRETG